MKENDKGIIIDFISSNKKILLLLGEGGTGKTIFCRKFSFDLASKLIKNYIEKNAAIPHGQYIPIYINLPTMHNPVSNLIEERLGELGITDSKIIQLLKETLHFVFILDGYDELSQEKLNNLYKTNKLYLWEQAKIIISCRTSHLFDKIDYWKHFAPIDEYSQDLRKDLYAEIIIAPFDIEKIKSYIRQWIENNQSLPDSEKNQAYINEWLDPEKCYNSIDKISEILELVKTPFLLWVTMQVLPTISTEVMLRKKENPIMYNKNALLSKFCDFWFKRQEGKLIDDPRYIDKSSSLAGETQKGLLWEYAKNLAHKMTKDRITVVQWPVTNATESEKNKADKQWATFFSSSPLPGESKIERDLIRLKRDGCPLIKPEINRHAFIHSEVQYFLDARNLTHSASTSAIKKLLPVAGIKAMFNHKI